FSHGVRVVGATGNSISLRVQASVTAVSLEDADGNVVDDSALSVPGGQTGVALDATSNGNRISRNNAFGAVAGIRSSGSGNLLLRNRVGNNSDGILVESGAGDTLVEGNTVV